VLRFYRCAARAPALQREFRAQLGEIFSTLANEFASLRRRFFNSAGFFARVFR